MSYKSTDPAPRGAAAEAWQATRQQTALATQFVADRDDDLAGARRDVGRPSGANEVELFVSCAPDLALQQQFEHLQAEFIAVHDLATTASRKLLVGLAAASRRDIQRLVVRRQGFGNPLATIEFVELPTEGGGALRLYSTAAEADTAARSGLARVLLGHSRLAVAMVGELPVHAVARGLQPFRDAMVGSAWPNREMLLLPLSRGAAMATQGLEFGRGTGVQVRATPQVSRPADAWGYIVGTWTRLREGAAGHALPKLADGPAGDPAAERSAARGEYGSRIERRSRERTPGVASAATPAAAPARSPDGTCGTPSPASKARPPGSGAAPLERYLEQVAALPGALAACVFDIESGEPAGGSGSVPAPDGLASQGRALLASAATACATLGIEGGTGPIDLAITAGAHHLVLRTLATRTGYALHAAFDRETSNLALARLQLQRLDALWT